MSVILGGRYIDKVILNEDIERCSYLKKLPVIRYLEENGSIDFTNDISIFVGENGTGKSTLLEAIAVAYGFNAKDIFFYVQKVFIMYLPVLMSLRKCMKGCLKAMEVNHYISNLMERVFLL